MCRHQQGGKREIYQLGEKITNRKSEQIVNADISADKTPKMRFRQIVQNYERKTIYDSRSCTTAAKNIVYKTAARLFCSDGN